MYVKPSKSSPAAIRKAKWEAEQKVKNAEAFAKVVAATKVSK
jgi:hypothetical protein